MIPPKSVDVQEKAGKANWEEARRKFGAQGFVTGNLRACTFAKKRSRFGVQSVVVRSGVKKRLFHDDFSID